MNDLRRLILGLAVLFIILAGFILYLSWPLLYGTEVVLKTRPVDPFDPLRGQYMRINYEISALPLIDGVKQGDTVYVGLRQNGDIWEYASASPEKPTSGIFMRGTVDSTYSQMRVSYGVEQFFFEQGADVPTQNITVKAKVSGNGGARIVSLLQNGRPVNITYRAAKDIS